SFDVERILPEAMLWQTGYMTIASKTTDTGWPEYCLKVPNHEVRTALNRHLLQAWHPDGKRWLAQGRDMRVWLSAGNSVALRVHFESLFASIPHDWYRKSSIANYEGYYASVFYSHLAALGLDIVGEDVTNEGRCDLVVRHEGWVYLFEFKVIDGDHPTGEALAQLLRKDYAAKYRQPDISIIQIGVEFSRVKRQIVGWEVA
ncbi:MAG: hypothetical protein EOM03_18375, partial [Clostridia bacterium]|nr:hypothetical protein [Clostridia bacterium]